MVERDRASPGLRGRLVDSRRGGGGANCRSHRPAITDDGCHARRDSVRDVARFDRQAWLSNARRPVSSAPPRANLAFAQIRSRAHAPFHFLFRRLRDPRNLRSPVSRAAGFAWVRAALPRQRGDPLQPREGARPRSDDDQDHGATTADRVGRLFPKDGDNARVERRLSIVPDCRARGPCAVSTEISFIAHTSGSRERGARTWPVGL